VIAFAHKHLSLLVPGTALAISAAFTMSACGDAKGTSEPGVRQLETRAGSNQRPLVHRGGFVAVKRSGRLIVLGRSGKLIRRVPRFVAANGSQGVELAPDRRHAFVSVRESDRPARLYEVNLATGAKRQVATAISPALSPDLTRLAYVSTNRRVDIVYRTALVIHELRTGRTDSIPLPRDLAVGTPPELVINWSPDGRRIAIFDGNQIRLVDVAGANDVGSQPSVPRTSASLAPVFVDAHTLVVLDDCCIGRQHLVAVDLRSGARHPFAVLSSPVENIRRQRSGLLLTVTALNELALVSQGSTRVIARGITAATG
jgi:hypothetical protein